MAHKRGNVDVITLLKSEIDMLEAQDVKKEIAGFIDRGSLQIVVDFSQVKYISTAVLVVLISCLKRIKEGGGRMCLSSIIPTVMQIFELTELNRIFDIYPTEAEAVASFGA